MYFRKFIWYESHIFILNYVESLNVYEPNVNYCGEVKYTRVATSYIFF